MSSDASVDRIDAASWQRRALWVAAAALSVSVLGAFFSPVAFFRAYLAAYLFYLGIGLGSMVLLMVYHLTGGSWGFLIRRILEAEMRTLPLLALLFLPIACGLRYLYLWAQPEMVAASPQLQYQQFYLAPTWFWIRALVYFAVWLTMAFLLASWSRQEDETGSPRLAWKSQQLAAFGAVAYGISFHFAAVDWGMSLQPPFHSTIWGPLFAAGQLLSGLAFALVVLACLVNRPPLAEVLSQKVRNDLGSLLFTFLILWAYMVWFQFMLIWIANMRVDVIWYLPRATRPWLCVIWAIVLLHFAVPFFLLLMRPIKRNSKALAWIAGLLLFMQLAYNYYQVIPEFAAPKLSEHWMDFLVPIGIGGVWLAHFMRNIQSAPLLAVHDCNRAAALHLRQLDAEEAAREEAILLLEKEKHVAGPSREQQASEQHRGDRPQGPETEEVSYPDSRIEHAAARYEPKDIRIGWLVAVVATVCCYAVLHYYGVWRFFRYQEHDQAETKKSLYPQASGPSNTLPPGRAGDWREVYTGVPPPAPLPPEPRLDQLDRMTLEESAAVNKQLAAEVGALHSYGPSGDKGFARVPIEEAIKAVAATLPVAKGPRPGRDANGLLDAGESNSGRMFRGPLP